MDLYDILENCPSATVTLGDMSVCRKWMLYQRWALVLNLQQDQEAKKTFPLSQTINILFSTVT